MIMWTCFLNLIGLFPYFLSYSTGIIDEQLPMLDLYILISVQILLLTHGCNIFIYFKFNKLFRRILINYFRKFTTLKKN